MTIQEKADILLAKAERRGDCLILSGQGLPYFRVTFMSKPWYAHRLVYFAKHGAMSEGQFVCHRCDTPDCINPDHLFLGTHQENMDDAVRKGRMAPGRPRAGRRVHVSLSLQPSIVGIANELKSEAGAKSLSRLVESLIISRKRELTHFLAKEQTI